MSSPVSNQSQEKRSISLAVVAVVVALLLAASIGGYFVSRAIKERSRQADIEAVDKELQTQTAIHASSMESEAKALEEKGDTEGAEQAYMEAASLYSSVGSEADYERMIEKANALREQQMMRQVEKDLE